jgi:glycosyltransferase involved in cell wall biosynthesis
MKIGIDISQIIYGTGVSWYTKNLVESLLKLNGEDEFVLFGGSLRRLGELKSITKEFKGIYSSKYYPISPVLADLLWNKIHVLPIELLIGKVDVFHTSDWTEPPCRAPKVTTIHDLTAIMYPESVRKDHLRDVTMAHTNKLNWVKKEADMIIAVSNATKRDIVKHLGINEDRIEVVYEAPDPIYQKKDDVFIDKIKKKYGISGEYILSVGTGKRKNNDRAYEAISNNNKLSKLSHVVAGRGTKGLEKGPVYVEEPSREEIAALYSGAKVLVYASSYEGFGLPILEAFSCGCPVVTSNVSSMPEVAGDGAVLVDPDSVESITEGILEAIGSRSSLIEKGSMRVKEFTWEKAARETLGVYKKVCKNIK